MIDEWLTSIFRKLYLLLINDDTFIYKKYFILIFCGDI